MQLKKFLAKIEEPGQVFSKFGWLPNSEIPSLLEYENRRSVKTDTPASIAIIDLPAVSKQRDASLNDECDQFYHMIIRLVSNNTRKYDVKYFINPSRIGVLLVNCTLEGARSYQGRIHEKIETYFNKNRQLRYKKYTTGMDISLFSLSEIFLDKFDMSNLVYPEDINAEEFSKDTLIQTYYKQNSKHEAGLSM